MNKVEWVSVKDILPDEGIDVLVYRDNISSWDMFVARFEDNCWTINGTLEVIEDGVTHWAYLPELPLEE